MEREHCVMKKLLPALAIAMVSGIGAERASANDFPTQARVEIVLACMDLQGGQNYDTLYACVCMVDWIASRISYRDYTVAETLSYLYATPGERGGIFRDAVPEARPRIEQFRTLRREAAASCVVSRTESRNDDG